MSQMSESAAGAMSAATVKPATPRFIKATVAVAVAVLLLAWGSPPMALAAGMAFALTIGNPFHSVGRKAAKWMLQVCVVALGFGMDLRTVLRAGADGAVFAAATIGTTLLLGWWVGHWLRMSRKTAALISAGTAICGGSAIAAVGSVLAVSEGEISVAMGTVFLLNAAALYLFPIIGHALHLSQQQFGMWAGVAIHDISSVVGASSTYGQAALQTATAVKLSRALWIVPLVFGMAFIFGRGKTGTASDPTASRRTKVDLPWFIGLFLLASVARSLVPAVAGAAPAILHVATLGLVLVLFLIGANLSRHTLKAVGWRAAVQGVALWAFISVSSLLVILHVR